MTRSSRRWALVAATAMILGAAGCGGSESAADDTGQATAGALEVDALSLSLGPDPVFAPHVVALEKGFFEEEGFSSAEGVTFESGAVAGEALAAGDIQLWTPGNLPPISMWHNGMPIVVLGTASLNYNEALVVRSDAGVERPEDLYELRIGLLEGSTASAILAAFADHYDLDPTRLQVVNLPPPEQVTALTNNEVQAILVWDPFPYLAAQQTAVEVLNDGKVSGFAQDAGDEVPISSTRSLWVTSEEFANGNPNSTAAMLRAMVRAQDYVADPANRDEVIEIFAEFTEQPVEQVEAVWDHFTFDPAIDDRYVADMQDYTDFLASSGRIAEATDPLTYTYTAPLAEIDPDAVTVEGRWQP